LRNENGLPDAHVISILDDGLGYLWLGLNRGVFRVARAQLDALGRGEITRVEGTHYLKGDGLSSIQCSEGSRSAIRTRDGRLWFATVNGISVVNPRELHTNTVPPPVLIQEVLVDGVPVAASRKSAADSKPEKVQRSYETLLQNIDIPPGRRRVEIR